MSSPLPHLLAAALFLAAGGCAGPSLRQDFPPAPAPALRAGDAWTYELRNAFNGERVGERSLRVSEAGGGVIVAQQDGTAAAPRFSAEWNPHSGRMPTGLPLAPFNRRLASGAAVNYATPFPALRFPLAAGARWSETVTLADAASGQQIGVRVDARVLGMERLRVPAGEFDAIKVRRDVYYQDGEWWRSGIRAVEIDWYAPQANRVVQRYEESEFTDRSSSGDARDGGVLRLGDRHLEVLLRHAPAPR